MSLKAIWILVLLGVLGLGQNGGSWPIAAAFADDDDDDNGDNDDDDDDETPVAPRLDRATDEITLRSLSHDDLEILLAQGGIILQEAGRVDATIRRLRILEVQTLEQSRDDVRALPSGQDADFNHYYRTEQEACKGPQCDAMQQIAFQSRTCLQSDVPIGIIDTGINVGHEVFAGRRLTVHRVHTDEQYPAGFLHGTAVAAIIVGDPNSRVPGLVAASHLLAVDAFSRQGGDERADAFGLVVGLDWLVQQDAAIINMSLAGPDNSTLSAAIDRAVAHGSVVVTAAGNGGPAAPPAFPAAYPGVISVTGVDADNDVFAMAQRGAHIDLVAPGVNVWTAASISGGRLKSGTSYAAPFMSSAVALLLSDKPDLSPDEVVQELKNTALDIGDAGHDDIYGAGLVQIGGWCASGN